MTMRIGEYVFKGSGATVYSSTFARGGLAAVFNGTVLQLVGSPTLVVDVEHKNREDVSFSVLGSQSTIVAGQFDVDLTGVKEEVRFAYKITATNAWEGVLLLMTRPTWRPYA